MSAPHQRAARTGGDLRILRAAVFAAVCVVLAAAGHALASCATIPLWTLGAGFLGVFALAAALAGRERSLPGITAVLTVGQTVLHTLFGLGQHGGAASMASMTSNGMSSADATLVARAAHLLCGTTAAAISPVQAQKILADARLVTGTDMAAMHDPADALSTTAGSWWSVLPSVSMLLGHLLAAVAAGWVLRRGDMALLRLMRLSAHGVAEGALVRSLRSSLALVRALLSGLPEAPETGPRPPRAWFLVPPRPRTTALQHTVIRRGPPPSTSLVLAA
ncbi:hypothetical protein ACFOZ0_09040 [Streptomyces yaanensis]|uniref:Integral membrane protein n=1 Tax=Streptomyces yaanensis TaxID=1142239 RepID=A0ABV7S8R5_9ACTN|nr:hypothetical protein [Streptomyces sp. CGMCC 4.7035]WNC02888.1 hypothetical protein Q2K21_35305 [Streptomyces sp. CGMCC 4.7035]